MLLHILRKVPVAINGLALGIMTLSTLLYHLNMNNAGLCCFITIVLFIEGLNKIKSINLLYKVMLLVYAALLPVVFASGYLY